MTDDRLLEELLRSPLDDMPERTIRPLHLWIGGAVALFVVGVAVVWVLSGDEQAPVVTTATGETVPATTAPGGSGTTAASVAATIPDAGSFQEMVAIGDGRMLMFGGFVPLSEGMIPLEGTWTFDVLEGDWDVADPGIAPSPRYGHAMAFHPPTGRVIVFGGGSITPRVCPRIRFCPGPEDNELWQYDPATGIWEDMTPADPEEGSWPVARFGARFAYEPVTQRLVMFGGVGVVGEDPTSHFWIDTWLYQPASNRWEQVPVTEGAGWPPGRVQYGFAWHPEARRVLMLGGDGIPADDDRLWAFDPATLAWEDRGASEPGEGPKERWFHLLTLDPGSERLVLVGGTGSIYQNIGAGTTRSNGNLDEVWTWGPADGWVAQNPFEGEELVGVTGGGEPASEVVVVYDGGNVWSYDAAGDSWTVVWERPEDDS